jgi:hypothetical protein
VSAHAASPTPRRRRRHTETKLAQSRRTPSPG